MKKYAILVCLIAALVLCSGPAQVEARPLFAGGSDTTIHGLTVATPGAGDDGKFVYYDHATTSYLYGTPAGGGDMSEPVWDGDSDGFIDADAGGTDQDSSAWTGVATISSGTWSAQATLTHELGGLEADVSAYNGLIKITGGATSGVTVTANGESLIGAADYAAMRTLLDLEAGTDFYSVTAADLAFQPLDAELTALSGVTSAANAIPYFTGSGTAGVISSSANMVSLLGSADYATARTNLGLAIGTDVQAYSATLAAIVAGSYSGATSFTTLGTITTGTWTGTAIDADYININALNTAITSRDNTDLLALWDTTAGAMVKMTVGNFVSGLGGAGSSVILDLADDGSNESTAILEIAVTNDTNSIFTEPTDDKLLINVSQNWPTADVANAGDSATSFFSSGTIEHERGGLEADVSAYAGLVKITGGATSAVTITSAGEAILDDADAETQRATLGLTIGTHVQAYDAFLKDIADLTDPGADRVLGWDDSEGHVAFFTADTDDFEWNTTTFRLVGEIPHLDVAETISGNWVNTANPWADNEVANDLTISGGTVNSSIIGGSTPAAGHFTTLSTTGVFTVGDELQSAGNITLQLGDAAGTYKFILQDSNGAEVFSVNSDGTIVQNAVNNPAIWLNEDDGTDYWIGVYDTTTDRLEFRRSATVNTNVDFYVDSTTAYAAGDMNIASGKVYKINGTQINYANLGQGGNATPTATWNFASATLQNIGAGTVTAGDSYTTISNNAADDTVNELFAAVDAWAAGVSAGTLINLSDVGGSDVYTAGYILIGDGSDSYDPKAVGGIVSLGSDGTVAWAGKVATGPTFDDDTGDSPLMTFKDATEQTGTIYKVDGSYFTITSAQGVSFADYDIKDVGDIAVDSISADGTNISIVAASGTVTVESVVFTGANVSSVGTLGLTGGMTISADEATLTHSGTTNFTIASTSGTVTVESVMFTGGAISGVTGFSLESGTAISFDSGDVTITHAENTLTFSGAASGILFTDPVQMDDNLEIHNASAAGAYIKLYEATGNGGSSVQLAAPDALGDDVVITLPSATGTLLYSGGALGTPASGTLTNATGLPIASGVSGLGTGIATALAVNVGSAGAPVVNGGLTMSQSPVIDDPDNFASNFTGNNLYGGTFISVGAAAGASALPAVLAGMNFTIIQEDTGTPSFDPDATGTEDTIYLNGVALSQGQAIVSDGTAGNMCVFQYRAADTWMATCIGFSGV